MPNINNRDKKLYIMLHLLLGVLLFYFPYLSSYIGLLVIAYSTYLILFHKNYYKFAPIICSAYIVGFEVLLRMSNSFLFWEFGKLSIIYIISIGFLRRKAGNSINIPIFIYFLLLLPSIIHLPFDQFNIWRQNITFNLAGPACLTILACYLYNEKVNRYELINILFYSLLPIFSMAVLILLRMPDISSYNFLPYSDPSTSGGFGPNQVSTVFGFIIAGLSYGQVNKGYLTGSKNIDLFSLFLFLGLGMITFSRGGLFTAIIAIVMAFSYYFFFSRKKIIFIINTLALLIISLVTWYAMVSVTEGAISQRYGMSGGTYGQRMVLDLSGRVEIYKIDLAIFQDYLFTGVGPGNATQLRDVYGYGKIISAHTEFSRMLSEHGLLGLTSLVLLLGIPVYFLITPSSSLNKTTKILFSILALLTMFHSAMRISMPCFAYCLLFPTFEE